MRMHRFFRNVSILFFISFLLILTGNIHGQAVSRIGVQEARNKVVSGKALLICAYSDYRCERVPLKDALLKSQLEKRLSDLPKDTELIFYCA